MVSMTKTMGVEAEALERMAHRRLQLASSLEEQRPGCPRAQRLVVRLRRSASRAMTRAEVIRYGL